MGIFAHQKSYPTLLRTNRAHLGEIVDIVPGETSTKRPKSLPAAWSASGFLRKRHESVRVGGARRDGHLLVARIEAAGQAPRHQYARESAHRGNAVERHVRAAGSILHEAHRIGTDH